MKFSPLWLIDETKDVKKTEQISLILRYYYRGVLKESFKLPSVLMQPGWRRKK